MVDIESASRELADALELTPHEAMELAVRYQALRQAERVTGDGDVLTEHDYAAERDSLNKQLKDWIEKHGPLAVEGIGLLRLQERKETVYDLAALYQRDHLTFLRMLELGCLKVDSGVMKAQVAAGNVIQPIGMVQTVSRALIVEE